VLDRALQRWPSNRQLLMTSAIFQRDAGNLPAARRTAEELAAAYPNDPEVNELRQQLR